MINEQQQLCAHASHVSATQGACLENPSSLITLITKTLFLLWLPSTEGTWGGCSGDLPRDSLASHDPAVSYFEGVRLIEQAKGMHAPNNCRRAVWGAILALAISWTEHDEAKTHYYAENNKRV